MSGKFLRVSVRELCVFVCICVCVCVCVCVHPTVIVNVSQRLLTGSPACGSHLSLFTWWHTLFAGMLMHLCVCVCVGVNSQSV